MVYLRLPRHRLHEGRFVYTLNTAIALHLGNKLVNARI